MPVLAQSPLPLKAKQTDKMMRAALLFLTIICSLVNSKPAAQIQNSLFSQSNQNNFGFGGGRFGGGGFGGGGFPGGSFGGFGGFGGFRRPGATQNCAFSQCNQNNFGFGK